MLDRPSIDMLRDPHLFAVTEYCFHIPATPRAPHYDRQISLTIIAHQVRIVAVTVSGHDQPLPHHAHLYQAFGEPTSGVVGDTHHIRDRWRANLSAVTKSTADTSC